MKKYQAQIIIMGLVLANFVFANIVFAQSVTVDPSSKPPVADIVTAQQLIDMSNKAQDIKQQQNAGIDVTNALNGLKQQCIDLGNKLETQVQYPGLKIQTWMNPGLVCLWGAKTGGVNTDDILGTNRGVERNDAIDNLRVAKMTGKDVTSLADIAKARQAEQAAINNQFANLNPALAVLDQVTNYILTTIFNAILTVLLMLIATAGSILNYAVGIATIKNEPAMVGIGWAMVRDFMNMFFILALIVMSIGTIIRRESLSARKLIINLILMALLINFSKVIAETLVGAADSVTRIFVGSSHLSWTNNYGRHFNQMVLNGGGFSNFFSTAGTFNSLPGSATTLVTKMIQVFTALLITASFGAIAVLLFVRLMGLWVLIMVSPAAYALNVLPQTQGYAKQWWSKFLKYLTWSPVAMFFIYMGQHLVDQPVSPNNNLFNGLFIAVFFWAALYIAKQAGMVGSGAILSYADKFWNSGGKMVNKYALRGGPVAGLGNLGAGALKKTSWGAARAGQIDKWNQNTFGLWRKGAQWAEATPQITKKGLAKLEDKYQEGVKKNTRAGLRGMGLGGKSKDDWEAYDSEEVQHLLADPSKLKRQQISDMTNSVSMEALHGAMAELANGGSAINNPANASLQEELRQGIFKRLGGGGPVPNGVLQPGTIRTAAGGKYEFDLPLAGGAVATRTLNVGSHDEAFERSLMTPEQLKQAEINERKLAAGNFVSDQAVAELTREQALKGIGSRTDIEKSIVTGGGQRVIISKNVAQKMGFTTDADLSGAEISELAKHLKDEGVSDTDISKVMLSAGKIGSVAIQKGSFVALKDVLPPDATREQRQIINQKRVEDKQHERSHGLYSFVKNNSATDYKQMVSAVMADPVFASLEKKFRSSAGYSGVSQEKIAEEILAKTVTREQLAFETKDKVNAVLDTHRPAFKEKTREIIKEGRLQAREEKIREKVIERVGAGNAAFASSGFVSGPSFKAVREAATEIKGAAGELSKATTGVQSAANEIHKATSELREANTLEKNENLKSNTELRKAADQISTNAKAGAARLDEAAETQEIAANNSAEELKKAANTLKRANASDKNSKDLNLRPDNLSANPKDPNGIKR